MRAEDRGHLDVIKLLVDYTASKVSQSDTVSRSPVTYPVMFV